MHRYIIIGILIGVVPWIIGKPWTRLIVNRPSEALAYGIGYFLELALFHIVSYPLIRLHTYFSTIMIVYSVCLAVCVVVCCLRITKYGLWPRWRNIALIKEYSWCEWILLLAIIAVIGLQVIRGFTYELTYMSYDDAAYTVMATDALDANLAGAIEPYTGFASVPQIKRTIQTSLYFPAYLSAVSGVSVPTIEHTVQYIQFLFLAYAVYVYMAGELFQTRINRLIFILILSVFYVFGYHSHYSLTFRLLGPNYQGKAVLAVSLTPLVLTMMAKKLVEPYQWKTGVLLMLLSLAAVSLTLWGTGTMAVIVTIPVILSFFRKGRNWKHLLYILWSCVAPAGFVFVFLLYKFAV